MTRPPSSCIPIVLAFSACLSICACATAGKDAPARLSAAERERVEAFRSDLEATRAALGMGRVTAAVVRDGRAEWTAALGGGDVSASFPLNELTETFTAAAALRLESRGKIRLDTPAADLDPAFPGPRTVLVRHLLSQTSEESPGTTFLFDSGAFAGDTFDYEEVNLSADEPKRLSTTHLGALTDSAWMYAFGSAARSEMRDRMQPKVLAKAAVAPPAYRVTERTTTQAATAASTYSTAKQQASARGMGEFQVAEAFEALV